MHVDHMVMIKCHTVKMNSLDLSRLHFNKIYIPVKK